MNVNALSHAKILLSKGCMNDIYKPVMDFIEHKLLPMYSKNTDMFTADYMIDKMCMVDYVISMLPQQKYPVHEWELVLMAMLADLSYCFPDYDKKQHHILSVQHMMDEYGDFLRKTVSDIELFKKTIEKINYSDRALINVHYGAGLNGMILHDVDHLTKIKNFYQVWAWYYNHSDETESGKKFTKSYINCKVRYGKQGTHVLFLKTLGNVHFFSNMINELKEALTTEEKFTNYLNQKAQENGQA